MNNKTRFSSIPRPAIAAGIVLFILCCISLYIRVALPYNNVFVDGAVWFKGTDAWYHMRLVDNLLQHFPQRIFFDPYTFYPFGDHLGWPPLFDWTVAASIRFFGGANPSPHTMDVIAAYVPPIMGTLTIFPVYFIGKELFNRWVGLLAAALLVVMPGEFLNRSLLGFTDHHVSETFFSTLMILFLILAIKRARQSQLSLLHVLHKNWTIITWPLVYALLAGLFLGIYLLAWVGGLMFLFILFAWIIVQFVIEHLRGESTEYLSIIGVLVFSVATVLFAPVLHSAWTSSMQYVSLAIAIATPLALGGISYLMKTKGIKRVYFPLLLIGLGAAGLALFYLIEPSLLASMVKRFGIFTPGMMSITILEANPLFLTRNGFTWTISWLNYGTTFYIALISLGWLIYLSIKRRNSDWTLFLIWCITMLGAVLGQRRFSYYYTVNVSLLTGYLCWRFLVSGGLEKLKLVKENTVRTARKAKKGGVTRIKRSFLQPRGAWFDILLVSIGIFFLVFFPCVGLPGIKGHTEILGLPFKLTQPLASQATTINQAWYDSLLWLKDNSPEPFGSADFYYEPYGPQEKHVEYPYPESAYSIMSWWDYGHWITRIAHRIPISNPFQAGVGQVASFFIAQNTDKASERLDELDSRYIITDYKMTSSIFYAIPTWAGKNPADFHETYYLPQEDGSLQAATLYYPSYYLSAAVRLHNFNGKAAMPDNSAILLTFEDKTSSAGISYREVTGLTEFSSYEEVEAYVKEHEYGRYVFGNFNPFVTPVPLEEMEDYELVYKSDQTRDGNAAVKIFEYTSSE